MLNDITISGLGKMVRKIATSITVDKELLDWIDSEVDRKRFASRSHAFEYAITKLKEE